MPESRDIASVRDKVARFEAAIEEVVKRHHPVAWTIESAKRLKSPNRQANYTPHELLDSIEASCRYRRGHRDDPVTEMRLRLAINVYREFGDPYADYVLEKEQDLGLWGHHVYRQQLELQMVNADHAVLLARHFWMMENPTSYKTTDVRMLAQVGFTVRQLFLLIWGLHGFVDESPTSSFSRIQMNGFEKLGISEKGIDSILAHSSRTLEQVRDDYQSAKQVDLKSPQLRFAVRSGFLDRPLITHENFYVAPLSHLLSRALGRIFWRVGRECAGEEFEKELSSRLEHFVGELLQQGLSNVTIWTERELMERAIGKVCDYLVETSDSVLLLECKAARATSQFVTKGWQRSDTSTRRILEAFHQLGEMGEQIRKGVFSQIIEADNRPLLGIVVTLDELPFPNSDWFWDNAVTPHFADAPGLKDQLADLLFRPQVMSVADLQLFLRYAQQTEQSPANVVRTKLNSPYMETGEWFTYLPGRMVRGASVVFPAVLDAVEKFMDDVTLQLED